MQIRVDTYPDQAFDGVVRSIASEAEFTSRKVQTPEERTILVYAVRIEVENGRRLLKPGLPADALLERSS